MRATLRIDMLNAPIYGVRCPLSRSMRLVENDWCPGIVLEGFTLSIMASDQSCLESAIDQRK